MEHVKSTEAIKHESSPDCTIFEYPMENREMNIALAEIRGRYPEKGYAVNHECSEMGFVVKGEGALITETKKVSLSAHDVVFLAKNEKYYWEGNLTVVLPCSPAWSAEQHEIVPS